MDLSVLEAELLSSFWVSCWTDSVLTVASSFCSALSLLASPLEFALLSVSTAEDCTLADAPAAALALGGLVLVLSPQPVAHSASVSAIAATRNCLFI